MEKRAMAVREEQWLQTIAAAKQSGQPIKVWCAEHGVPVSSFYKWQRKMRDSLLTAQNSEIQFQELEVPQNICGPATSDRIHLHIQDILVELPAGASAEQISAVILLNDISEQLVEKARQYFSDVDIVSPGEFTHSKLNSSEKNFEANHEAELLIVCR